MHIEETFQTTFGAMFIAFFLDAVLYGAGILLVLQYFRSFADPWPLRLFVLMLAVFSTTQVTAFFAWAYDDLIIRFGNNAALIYIPHSGIIQLISIFLVSFSAQMFFAMRIRKLSKREHRIWLCGPVVILALLQISSGLALAVKGATDGTFRILVATENIQTIQSGSSALCDIAITIILCHVLNKSRTGMKNTDSMLDKLIVYTINRGAMTSLAAFLNMILFIARPRAMIFMCALLPSGQLYVISVVATLLARNALREELTRSLERRQDGSLPLSSLTRPSGIHVSTSVVTWDAVRHNPYDDGVEERKVPLPPDKSKTFESAAIDPVEVDLRV